MALVWEKVTELVGVMLDGMGMTRGEDRENGSDLKKRKKIALRMMQEEVYVISDQKDYDYIFSYFQVVINTCGRPSRIRKVTDNVFDI